ncbi:MAG: carboxypeptidase-like regulatory domain-containing protein [Bacteroidaceae bacterium]|nr:carboxypeptidase-like regulatory domain-containing protein [Bacteroidaceae bacterium]
MKKHLLILLFAVLAALPACAQSFTLKGRVTDSNGSPVELCAVAIPAQGKVTMTNLKGEYSISGVSADSVKITYSMVGFKAKTRVLRRPKGKMNLTIQLQEGTELAEVAVMQERRQTGQSEKLDIKDAKAGPSVTGNAVEEMVKMQAGVGSRNELSSQYNVRGGSFDENSVYINGVEIYRPFLVRSGQQEGLSVINADMVDRVEFSTGGFDAKYGDKMSSALDITYKKPKKFEAKIDASLLGGGVYIGFATKTFAWQNGFRYKTNRMLLSGGDQKAEYDPRFLDYQTYLTFEPNKRWKIELLGDIADNRYNFTPQSRETTFGGTENSKSFKVYFDGWEKDIFRTYFGSAAVTHSFTENTKLQLQGSIFFTNEQETYDIQGQYWLQETGSETGMEDDLAVGTYSEHARNYLKANVKSVKLTFQHKTKKHNWLAAFTYKNENISENSKEYEMRDSAGYVVPHTGDRLDMIYSLNAQNELKADRIEAFVQDSYRFSSKGEHAFFTLNYGVRFAYWSFNKESIVSPRVSLSMAPAFNNNFTFRFATGLYYQAPFYKELRDTITTNGVTIARLNDKVKSQRSIHFIAGMDYRFKLANRRFRLSTEMYYKLLGNLIPYSVNNMKIVYDSKEQVSGHAFGLDAKLYGEFVEGTDSWITLSLMQTRMNIHGNSVPLPSDMRYAINVFFTDYFPGTTRWKMAVRLSFADGLPFGAPHRDLGQEPYRAPAYKRVDLGLSYRVLENKSIFRNIWLSFDCLNVIGSNNVNSYYWITDVTNRQFAVPNYLTGRTFNGRVVLEF